LEAKRLGSVSFLFVIELKDAPRHFAGITDPGDVGASMLQMAISVTAPRS
jgi:hypothetical protein